MLTRQNGNVIFKLSAMLRSYRKKNTKVNITGTFSDSIFFKRGCCFILSWSFSMCRTDNSELANLSGFTLTIHGTHYLFALFFASCMLLAYLIACLLSCMHTCMHTYLLSCLLPCFLSCCLLAASIERCRQGDERSRWWTNLIDEITSWLCQPFSLDLLTLPPVLISLAKVL